MEELNYDKDDGVSLGLVIHDIMCYYMHKVILLCELVDSLCNNIPIQT